MTIQVSTINPNEWGDGLKRPPGLMRHARRWIDPEGDEAGANRQTASLAGLALTLLLVVVALGLTHALQRKSAIEDCLLAGRINCSIVVEANQ